MSDSPKPADDSADKQDNSLDEQVVNLDLELRAKLHVAQILGEHDLLTDEGKKDVFAVADMVYPTISAAVVHVPGERERVGITPNRLVEEFFPEVPGPSDWANYEDEDERAFHERVYVKLKGEIFRVLSVDPDGPVQSRLSMNGSSLVLCRTRKTKGREERAYVTRNTKCINEDNNTPALNALGAALAKAAGRIAMAIERVPESATTFNTLYSNKTKNSIESGKNIVRAALEAAKEETSEPVIDNDGDGSDE